MRLDSGGEVINSTITGNVLHTKDLAAVLPDEMSGYGDGIDHRGGNDVAIVNSAIAYNHALKGGGGVNSGQGYIPVSDQIELGRVRLLNSIIAHNTSEAGPWLGCSSSAVSPGGTNPHASPQVAASCSNITRLSEPRQELIPLKRR